jgi:hypothetical protein
MDTWRIAKHSNVLPENALANRPVPSGGLCRIALRHRVGKPTLLTPESSQPVRIASINAVKQILRTSLVLLRIEPACRERSGKRERVTSA